LQALGANQAHPWTLELSCIKRRLKTPAFQPAMAGALTMRVRPPGLNFFALDSTILSKSTAEFESTAYLQVRHENRVD
jgi:hypothetical protein